ncbi:hypothetical protein KVR01_002061 [Diaporthe batatas]|uniref:uncharacterized protein n=1 Tax=Diaporthe batatas TaxID=748121 RepID=UPI001D059429|nr:uncharacterized protein KVR01_002061 [Diaporthe batatas]KAG8166372.1 hypothetical protein KVR01_002061 [Diaporthe batatas]
MFVPLLIGLALAYFGWSVVCLERNVRKARSLGIPVVRLPIDPVNFLWVFLQGYVWRMLDLLPIAWPSYPDFVRFSYRGWHFREKSSPAVRFGPIINTQRIELLEVYGPCISTAGWDDWPRHRKVLAAPFNERIMSFVWDESLRQAEAMLRSWCSPLQSKDGVRSVQRDTRTLSLNVLAATGFRKTYDFRGSADVIAVQDEAGSYRDALQTVLDNALLIMILPYKYLRGSLMPRKLLRIGNAARSFKRHMVQMLEDETTALRNNKPDSGSLMGAFVRALDRHERETVTQPDLRGSKDGKRGLSIEEIFGNLFVINFVSKGSFSAVTFVYLLTLHKAGHDTTANTLAFTMLLLAAHPEAQAWVAEEVSTLTVAKNHAVDEWDYECIFPRLRRCQAVLLETLRLYPPIMSLPKWTKDHSQAIQVGDKTLVIPPGVGTSAHLLAVHTHPKYWRDPFVWRPSRWIIDREERATGSKDSGEELWTPLPHTYFPWSDGPQNCPGEKFSKVETVAVLACLLKSHRLRVKKFPGEAEEAARERAIKCTNNVNLEILLRMRDADSVRLVCEKA